MTNNFVLFHLKSAGKANLLLPQGYWHLATCLRSIVITEQDQTPPELYKHQKWTGEKAYEFLLQVICGLDSPLVGETEILGQFKQFMKSHRTHFGGPILEIVENLMRDAKKIRASYLQNLGCTSYGSLLRKQMQGEEKKLVIVGAGSLVQDIVPWFAKNPHTIQLFTRSPQKHLELASRQENIQLAPLDRIENLQPQGFLVIAAPVSAAWLQSKVSLQDFDHIYDLRGNSAEDVFSVGNVTSLQSLFSNIEANKTQAGKVKQSALMAVKKRALYLSLLEKPRPFGWEDLWTYA